MFLKKEGKATYSKPGSYRPISISPYIGKLFERILGKRLESYLSQIGLLDPNQEGFSKGRNTVRYLHRLSGTLLKSLQFSVCFWTLKRRLILSGNRDL